MINQLGLVKISCTKTQTLPDLTVIMDKEVYLLLLLLARLRRHHAGPGDGLEELLDLWGAGDELVLPELEGGVLDELDEGDEEAPRVRTVHDQTLQEDPRDLR